MQDFVHQPYGGYVPAQGISGPVGTQDFKSTRMSLGLELKFGIGFGDQGLGLQGSGICLKSSETPPHGKLLITLCLARWGHSTSASTIMASAHAAYRVQKSRTMETLNATLNPQTLHELTQHHFQNHDPRTLNPRGHAETVLVGAKGFRPPLDLIPTPGQLPELQHPSNGIYVI